MRSFLPYFDAAAAVLRSGLWEKISCRCHAPQRIPEDFIGLNVASSDRPGMDEAVLNWLAQLPLRELRMDLDSLALAGARSELIDELTTRGYRMLIHPLLSPGECQRLPDDSNVQAKWIQLIEDLIQRFAGTPSGLRGVEIGATVNRRRWSGYSLASFQMAWKLAAPRLRAAGIPLVGPNVSDFEPPHTWAFLAAARRAGGLPDAQSVNLFVERVREPEAFDPRVLGRRMRDRLQLNLIKKARVFADISARLGIPETLCTHTCWNAERVARWVPPEEVENWRARLLERYLLLAAASGALQRVYWGPLIGYPDGLVYEDRPENCSVPPGERVAAYLEAPGSPETLQPQPAFEALKNIAAWLPGSILTEVREEGPEGYDLQFQCADGSSVQRAWKSGLIAG